MARKKKTSVVKRVAIVGAVLIVVQLFYIFVFGAKEKPLSMREAINKAVDEKTDLTVARREQAKVQLALADYQSKNGKLPQSLDELVPTYFDVLPADPDTNQPFKYRVDGVRYFLGDESANRAATKAASGVTIEPAIPGAPTTLEEQQALIQSLVEGGTQETFVYDPTGKRDPFQPFDFSPKGTDSQKTPLEHYSLGQLKLTAVLEGMGEPTAIVENNVGKGFTVKKGTKIGTNNGEVVEIQRDKILILETETDFTGQQKSRTSEIRLRTKDESENQRQGNKR